MCLGSSPSAPPDPEKPQEAKMAEQSAQSSSGSTSITDARRKAAQRGGAAAGTMLTGPSGVENSALKLSRSSLLGY